MKTVHKTVLLKETIDLLDIAKGDIVVDATLNAAGHSIEAYKRQPDIHIIGIDADPDAIERAKHRFEDYKDAKFDFVNENFRNIERIVHNLGLKSIDRVIFDLGLSSDQLDTSGRGFSFKRDEPLQMSFKRDIDESDITASYVVNDFAVENLETIIKGFGEEEFAWKIAKAIEKARDVKRIEGTRELADIIKSAVPAWYRLRKIHPATKTFQAIRMTVNDELGALENGLFGAWEVLRQGGRIAVISFHSIEDRVVKQFFKEKAFKGEAVLITKKPIIANEEEINENPRSRSAKLRVIEKTIKS
jgi:16S rRNA (cytosine1402-N4)-methyltransferase